jgi:hypothetical protein
MLRDGIQGLCSVHISLWNTKGLALVSILRILTCVAVGFNGRLAKTAQEALFGRRAVTLFVVWPSLIGRLRG